ncbi:hypothetical protein GCWU000246_01411 [Jonquetella anthropi E3_33 E1]|nr:hypothetical protein GCWU000246_01411 [Jonquetella anthropi E3_33 E1]
MKGGRKGGAKKRPGLQAGTFNSFGEKMLSCRGRASERASQNPPPRDMMTVTAAT